MNAMIPFSDEELCDMVWTRTGKSPVSVRTQALLVIAEFGDGAKSVHRIEHLVVDSAMRRRLGLDRYMEWEAGQ